MRTRKTQPKKPTLLEKLERVAKVYKLNLDKLVDYIKAEYKTYSGTISHLIMTLECAICTNENNLRRTLK